MPNSDAIKALTRLANAIQQLRSGDYQDDVCGWTWYEIDKALAQAWLVVDAARQAERMGIGQAVTNIQREKV